MSRSLIIVESPAKARTLKKYLGKSFDVKASVGHIRDLPVNDLGVDVEHGFSPKYVTIRGKGKIISELKSAAQKADAIYLAPDPDREGEAIAFHIAEILGGLKKPLHRVLFHELTKKAILASIEKASEVNQSRFEAQQARRILDRLVGYQISPLLWEKVRRGLSAGRVQSVAVRMVCEREEDIEAFVSEEYWSISAQVQASSPPAFNARLDRVDGKTIDNKKVRIENEQEAQKLLKALQSSDFIVSEVAKKRKKRYPSPPFITSTMQMEANRKLRFTAKKTMMLAQKLYEGVDLGDEGPTGLITYMRTDSTRINDEALVAVREHIQQTYGAGFLPPQPNRYKNKQAAQDAHEAIRPTDVSKNPETMQRYLDKDLLALYTLIWKRYIASQMNPAEYDQTTVRIDAGKNQLKAVGSIMRFLGFMTVYVEATDDVAESQSDQDVLLPEVKEGDRLKMLDISSKQHFTQPPPRYTEATLVKALEENGVGRPSTYASILSTIQDKEYVLMAERKFMPTDLGKLVNRLLVMHFPDILNIEFTASMEQQLDKIEEGSIAWQELLQKFYGPFRETLNRAKEEMESVKKIAIKTDILCEKCKGTMVIKWGRNGEFLACENFPECTFTQDFSRNEEGAVVPLEREEPEQAGENCDKCGQPMVYRQGRFGRFLACSGYPQCRNIKSVALNVSCPEEGCPGEIVQKVTKRGKVFFGCNKYPQCKFASWDKPVNEACPSCDSPFLVEKDSKKTGPHLRCPNKTCHFTKKIESESDETK